LTHVLFLSKRSSSIASRVPPAREPQPFETTGPIRMLEALPSNRARVFDGFLGRRIAK
jgi:hypothetical protein